MPDDTGDKPSSDKPSSDEPMFTTAADAVPSMKERLEKDAAYVPNGLSVTHGLQEIPGSQAPARANGEPVAHVLGPQQAACDPVAAGIDTTHNPMTRQESRVITRTGRLGSGAHPATYVEKGEGAPDVPSDGSQVEAISDADAAATPGPSAIPKS